MLIENPKQWVGKVIEGYELKSILGNGKIGYVFLAEHKLLAEAKRACKIIRSDQLKPGWELEIQKVKALSSVPQIVDIQSWNQILDEKGNSFTYINYQYIDGENLNEYLNREKNLSITFLQALGEALIYTKHACDAMDLKHGDLHEGNILISKPDPRLPDNPIRIYVTDFGCGGSHNMLTPKPDSLQISSIMCRLLKSVRIDRLEATERSIREKLIIFFWQRIYRFLSNECFK